MDVHCPRCRQVVDGRLQFSVLEAHPVGLHCQRCSAIFPVVDDVPIVLRDTDTWLETEGAVVLARRDLQPGVRERILAGANVALRRAKMMEDSYVYPIESALQRRVGDIVSGLPGPVIDLGCGAGIHRRKDVLGIDISFALARAFVGHGMVADAADPPFSAASFASVLLLNVLDATTSPRTVLGQADALLQPNGTLVISCPYAWNNDITAPAEQFGPASLLEALTGGHSELDLRLSYDLAVVEDPIEWRIRAGHRSVRAFDCQLVVAVKR